MAIRLLLAMVLACVFTRAHDARAQSNTLVVSQPLAPVKHSEDELVVIDLTGDKMLLSEGMTGYATRGGLLLPLSAVADALEFPIRVSVKDGTASGWFIAEENLFSLNLGHGEVIVKGERKALAPGTVELQPDDIYVDSATLGSWFGVNFNFTYSTLTVDVVAQPGVRLPFEAAAENEKRRRQLGNRQVAEKNYPLKQAPYKILTTPFVDVNSQTEFTDEHTKEYASALVTNDLLYMHNDTFVNMENSKLSDLRVTLSRRSPDGKLFSDDEPMSHTKFGEATRALGISEVAAGDIYSSQLPLTGRNQGGRGLMVSNEPYDRVTQFNTTTLEGDILPNWDVEIYRNDELLDFQKASGNGHYEFRDVQLLSGTNIIRLVFYGPHGETREETRQILVRSDITREGESYFRMTVMQQDNSLLQVREDNRSSLSQGVGLTPSELDAIKGKLRSSFEYEYGLVDNVALYGNAVTLPTGDGEEQKYVTAGLGTSLFGVYTRGDASVSSGNGHAFQGLMQTSLYGATLSAKHQYFADFLSDYTGNITDPIKQYSELRANRPFSISGLPTLNLGVSNIWNDYTSGRRENEFTQRVSMYVLRGLYVSHDLNIRDTYLKSSPDITRKDGVFTLSTPLWGVLMRGQVGYDIAPGSGINDVQVAGDYFLRRDVSLHVGVDHRPDTSITTYDVGATRHLGKFLVGATASYNSDHDVAAYINLAFSFGRDAPTRHWGLFPDNTARSGTAYARAYLDKNNNGVYDAGDRVIPGATFNSTSGGRAMTNADGIAFLPGLRTEGNNDIELEEDSLENAYWVVKDPGYSVASRAGAPVMMDFAVVESGDIDGNTTLLDENGNLVTASNVDVELVDEAGKVVRTARSSYDGYYLIDRVPVGIYTLRVSPDQMKRKAMEPSVDKEVIVAGEASLSEDFTLMPLPQEAPAI